MASRFSLDNTFCVSFFWLALFAGCGMLLVQPLFRRTQKYHSALLLLEKQLHKRNTDSPSNSPQAMQNRTNFYKDEELDDLVKEIEMIHKKRSQKQKEIELMHQRGLQKLRVTLHETSIFPAAIIDIILLYSYSTNSKKIYLPIYQDAMFEQILYQFRIYSRCIEVYCFIRTVMVMVSFAALAHQYVLWHHRDSPQFLRGCTIYIYVMLYHPIYKGSISRIWNAYNVSARYLPVVVQMALRVEMMLFLLIGIVHGIQLFVSVNVFAPYTLALSLYYTLQKRLGALCIKSSGLQKLPWWIKEPFYFMNMYALWFVVVFSIWVYTMAIGPFLNGNMHWGESFAFGFTGEHCQGFTVDSNDWGLILVLVTWALF